MYGRCTDWRWRGVSSIASTRSSRDEVNQKTERLQTLYDYMRRLSQATDRNDILDLVMEYAQRTTQAGRISLMMLDPSGESLVCVRAVGIDREVVDQIRVDARTGIAGKVFQSGQTIMAQMMRDAGTELRGYGSDTFVSTPLVSTSLGDGGTACWAC